MIKDVKVIPGCISCRNCETVCPSIFKVSPKSKVISNQYQGRESEILQAEALCPVNVIKVEKQGEMKIDFSQATLREKNWLTRDILELVFDTHAFHAVPGQYISLRLRDGYGDFSRSYSLAEYSDTHFTLTVKILKNGR
jgi:ferredoxin